MGSNGDLKSPGKKGSVAPTAAATATSNASKTTPAAPAAAAAAAKKAVPGAPANASSPQPPANPPKGETRQRSGDAKNKDGKKGAAPAAGNVATKVNATAGSKKKEETQELDEVCSLKLSSTNALL